MRERGDAHREGSVDSEGVKRFVFDFAFVHPSLSLELSRQLDPNLMQGVDISGRRKLVAFPPTSSAPYGKMFSAPYERKLTDKLGGARVDVVGSIWEDARVPLELRGSRVPVGYIVTRTASS